MNKNYPLARPYDPDFDKPHPYTKSYGDGIPQGYCRCGRSYEDPIHTEHTGDRELARV